MQLIDWINEHDCGVKPTGVALEDGRIEIRIACSQANGSESVESVVVASHQEARAALGY